MTSRDRESSHGGFLTRALRAGLLGLSSIALTILFAIPSTVPAAADPPLTVAEAKAQIAQLETDAAAIDQEYVGVKDQIDQGTARLALKQADVTAKTAEVSRMKAQVGQVALAQFQNRNLDTAAQLFVTPDTEGFLSQISTVEKVTENQNAVLQDYQQEQASLADLEHSAETDLAMLRAQGSKLAELRAASDKKIAESKAVLAKLTDAERRFLAEEERKATEKANAEGEALSAAADDDAASPAGTGKPAATVSGRGAKALAFARAQVGKPYRFGASGPGAYDCSGLTGSAWRSVGVSLPRTSQSQFGAGRAVAKSDLQVGDLIFFYSDLSHVGIYAGNGMIVHSPRPGKTVQFIKMSYMPYAGARRPG